MPRSFGQAIPPIPPQHPSKNEVAWRNCVQIRRITENDKVNYNVEFEYPSDGGDTHIDELIRKCLNEFVKQLP
jgi:hypothetical protein